MNKKPILILVVCAFASFLATFNETFLNIAFTPIMKDLDVSVSVVQWLTTAYMLGAAIMVPISSFLYRKFKTKPLFLFTVGLLIVGSLICALAPSFPILLTGRIIQSLGTGMLVPISMNMTLSVVPKDKIGTYMGIMGAMTTLGPSFSIIAAGVLLAMGSWHLLFWLFGIFCTILFILGIIILKSGEKLENTKLDIKSVILIALAMIGIMYGLSTVFSGNRLIALLFIVIGIISLTIFVKRQNKINTPLVNLKPLKVKQFRYGIILNMLALMTVFSMNIIMPLFVQNALGLASITASLTLFPAVIFSCIMSPIAGKIYDKKGIKQILPLGFILIFVFILLLALTRDMNSRVLICLLYIPVICGSGLIIGPAQSYALSHLKREENPDGVTMISTGFQVAGCIGSSLFTGVYSLVLAQNLAHGVSQYNSLSSAFFVTLLTAALISLIGLILSIKASKIKEKAKEKDMTLSEIMQRDVYTVNENTSLLETLQFITDHKISGVPVLDGENNLTGFISDGDIMRYLSKAHPLFTNAYSFMAVNNNDFDENLKKLMNLKVKDISKKKLVTIKIDTPLDEACNILTANHLKKAPVMDGNKMVGVINRSNITKYAVNYYLSLN